MSEYTDRLIAMKPLAFWPLNDAGSPALDLSGNGRNMTFSNVTWGQAGIGDGQLAADFNGTTAAGTSLTNATWINGTTGTMALWIKLAAGTWTDTTARIIARFSGDGTGNNYCEFTRSATNNRLQLGLTTAGSSKVLTYDTAGPTTWLHMAWTWTSTTITLYANGTQVAINSTRINSWVSSASGYVQFSPGSFWHKGGLGDVILFNRALDVTQLGLLARVTVPTLTLTGEITTAISREGKL